MADLEDTIAELRRVSPEGGWTAAKITAEHPDPMVLAGYVAATINAVLSGDLIPRADAELAAPDLARKVLEQQAEIARLQTEYAQRRDANANLIFDNHHLERRAEKAEAERDADAIALRIANQHLTSVAASRDIAWAKAEAAAAERDAAMAEVQRLREENARIKALLTPPDDVPWVTCDAIIHGSAALDRFSGDEPLVPADALNVARADRDAALARVEKLREAVSDFATAKIDALRYSPPYGSSPEDEPDPVVDAETVWALQIDARAALDEDARHG